MDNRSFWDERYTSEAWLGSGPGSRGVAAQYKADLLRRIVTANRILSIADIGCGDLCWLDTGDGSTGWMDDVDYLGVDISAVIVARNAEARPGSRFIVHDIAAAPLDAGAELTVCFDVLLHQVDRPVFDAALANLLRSMRDHALVSYINPDAAAPVVPKLEAFDGGIEERFQQELRAQRAAREFPRGMTNCFGALPALIAAIRPDLAVRAIGRYRYQEIYEVSTGGWLSV